MTLDVSDAKGNKEVLLKQDIQEQPFGENGCRLYGTVQVQKVAADLSFAHEGSVSMFSLFDFFNFNSSHVINHLRFGPQIPDMKTPLIDVHKIVTNNCAWRMLLLLLLLSLSSLMTFIDNNWYCFVCL